MIRIKAVHIEEFRGIRSLDLDLNTRSFGICGPNGTGKSGVVDAIEFCLTGDVTRLSGQGSAGLSVKSHAPHVDQLNHPEKSSVVIAAEIPSSGKAFEIRRSVKYPRKVNISPVDSDIIAVVEELQSHPEFALSRREIVKYIITPPGRRSDDVQTLLRLEYLEDLRKNLTTFTNKRRAEFEEAARSRRRAETELCEILEVDHPTPVLILEKVNEVRGVLGLQTLTELTESSSLKTGIVTPKDTVDKPVLRKVVALTDLAVFQSSIKEGEPPRLIMSCQIASAILEQLREDEQSLVLARRHALFKSGLDLITEDACPLCDREWNSDELREHLRKKVAKAEAMEQLLEKLRENVNVILQVMQERTRAIEKIIQYTEILKPSVGKSALANYIEQIRDAEVTLKGFLEDYSRIESAAHIFERSWWTLGSDQLIQIDECHAALKALPDVSAEEEARDALTVAQERYEKSVSAKRKEAECNAYHVLAKKILAHYNNSCTSALNGIYDQVGKEFSRFYSIINREDEEEFVGKLRLMPAKLDFDVDFYGRGHFPPGAYHSEGHQDAMGLCLYLALMKHTLGQGFTFSVLDDVLMSVDTGHRREVCRLLKSEFPKTQFIVTTHDRVWLHYMKSEGLIDGSQQFGGWTVDSGPRIWDDLDIWTEIQTELDKDNIPKAAGLLRRYLEYTASVLADNLRARVEFRGDGRYDLGDLMPHVLKQWRKILEDGEKAATQWKRFEEKATLAAKRESAKELVKRTSAEEWAINPTVHFNEWANLHHEEFSEVVDAFKELLESLRCEKAECGSYLYLSPSKGKAEQLRCNCGFTNINLKLVT